MIYCDLPIRIWAKLEMYWFYNGLFIFWVCVQDFGEFFGSLTPMMISGSKMYAINALGRSLFEILWSRNLTFLTITFMYYYFVHILECSKYVE